MGLNRLSGHLFPSSHADGWIFIVEQIHKKLQGGRNCGSRNQSNDISHPVKLLLNSLPSYLLPPNISLYHLNFCCKAWSGEGKPKASEHVESLTFPVLEFKWNMRMLFSHMEFVATRMCRQNSSSRFGKNTNICIKTKNIAAVLISSNSL